LTTQSLRLSPVQARRKAVLLAAIVCVFALFAVTRAQVFGANLHEAIEIVGMIAILGCIFGRCWCSLYIGGRKISELVTVGPYSLCRNPLYTFTFIGAAGAMAQSGSLTLVVVGSLITWIVFRLVVRKEERLLTSIYGETYEQYLKTTPRFLPNFSLWQGVETVEARPKRIVFTFVDGLAFFLAVPVAEVFEHLQTTGVVPVLLQLP